MPRRRSLTCSFSCSNHFDTIKTTTKGKKKHNWIGQCTEVALEKLPIILQKAEKRPKLARYLRDKSLQSSSSGILYDERKAAGIDILKYVKARGNFMAPSLQSILTC